ncbi:HsdR family type I site-specific deoxyribonuclease [Methanococcus maripaludis X1]|uniref:type I site-specific deoxyribonuclease n=1 Tax=Methanococcus maripaludis X1 TaxID=1053692 RepID=G0GZN2_METMI|nr:type I restriction endonuclease subunit R [Methanococcus maripaludis]AEK19763.1 HsdR family type I site-specific deoxyribonuclease [Methanococcus maripaludis X1]
MSNLCEDTVEQGTLELLKSIGYEIISGPEIAPDGTSPERKDYSEVVLVSRLRDAISRINPKVPVEAREDALRKVLRLENPNLLMNNEKFHEFIFKGIDVEYPIDGRVKGDKVYLLDKDPLKNEFVAVNQFTIIQNNKNRRPDIVIFVNGLPLSVIELKNPTKEDATIWSAYNQIQTYKSEISELFKYNELILISDGTESRIGTLSSNKEWFLPWKSIDGTSEINNGVSQLKISILGMFDKTRFIDIIKNFIVFKKDGKDIIKVIAGYHQYFAANRAIEKTIEAVSGNRRCGVVWHTQGSGKSLTMAFYAGKLAITPELRNPTIVVVTDRNDLDDQLFGTFASCIDVLKQTPVQAKNAEDLKEQLKVVSGGVIFTTMQKFSVDELNAKYPMLSDRENIIVMADEAHRSQYGLKAKSVARNGEVGITYGFAKYLRDALPNASFIGFTGTPIDFEDKSTRSIFGEYIDIYDVRRAVADGRTVKIYYESRVAKIGIENDVLAKLDAEFEEVTEFEENYKKEKLKGKWAQLEAIVGSNDRISKVAQDIVNHFEKREETLTGKAIVVCMSRRICVDLYDEIIRLRPEWHNDDDKLGVLKVIMTGSAADGTEWQKHIRTKGKRKELAEHFKDSESEFKIAIVRDMWLTGFDVPCLHTLYIDKPMKGHGLMQAIARVNRVFRDKPGGLVVDYIGIAQDLKYALVNYTSNGGTGKPTYDIEDAVNLMKSKYEAMKDFFYGHDYSKFFNGTNIEKMDVIPETLEFILNQPDGKKRFVKLALELIKSYALSLPHEEAIKIREEVAFFTGVKAALYKNTEISGKPEDELNSAIKQIVSGAVRTDGIIDVFGEAGLEKPDISILSEQFLEDVKNMKYKNLALETLKKILNDEIRAKFKNNLLQEKKFSEMIENAIKRYHNKAIDSAAVIQELIAIAKEIENAKRRGEELHLTEEELAFYDALSDNDSAKEILGTEVLSEIARELTDTLRKNISIDWEVRETVRATLRVRVKRLLKKYGYPPDKAQIAADLVLKQAETISKEWMNA